MNMKGINFILKRNRRSRGVRLSVYCDGSCVVSAPYFVSEDAIRSYVREKSDWIRNTLQKFMPFKPRVRRINSKAQYAKYKEAARKLVELRLPELNKVYGFKTSRIAIRNQKSRWGSCSAKGNLNFNYKIALLPPHLADYLIVHELCHLREFNHSQNFWDLVAKAVPDYRLARAELKNFRVVM
jgi:predicted metal-dependent hydrolase